MVVDFEAHTISDNDFNGIKKLLQQVQQREAIIESSYNCTRAESDVTRTPTPFFSLETGIFKGPCQHVRDGGNHHPAESRRQRHQGELFVH